MVIISFASKILTGSSKNYRRTFGRDIATYNHTISFFGGFDTASFSLNMSKKDISDLFTSYLGSHVEVYDDYDNIIWAGFINEILISIGGMSNTIGPLVEVSNKILLRYTDFSTGVSSTTTYANDTDSQLTYGIFTRILSSGSISSTNATNIRDAYLKNNKYPKNQSSLSSGNNEFSVTVNCLGYYHIFNTYVYNNSSSGSTTVSSKISSILSAEPNNTIFTANNFIETNALSVSTLENSDKTALDILKSLVALGDSNNNRTTLAIYENEAVYYYTVQYSSLYKFYIGERTLRTEGGMIVSPQLLKPGTFIELLNVDIPIKYSNIQSNPRYMFIESINYTYPYDFSITGSDVTNLPQQLAKLGLGGI